MRKTIVVITLLSVFSLTLLAESAIPVVELPSKPTKALMNSLNKNRELYLSTILGYYQASVAYETQLVLLGKSPTKKLVAPTFQQLFKPNAKLIQAQWKQASALYNQITSVDALVINEKQDVLRERMNLLNAERMRIQTELDSKNLELQQYEQYEKLYYLAIERLDAIRIQLNENTVPTLGVSAGATGLNFFSPQMNSYIGPSIGLYFNPTQLFGIGNYFDCWVDFSNPTITSSHNLVWGEESLEHSTSMVSAGVNWIPPLKLLNANLRAKLGVGYFCLFDRMPNTELSSETWQGVKFNIELEYVNFARNFPFGIYVSYSPMLSNKSHIMRHPYEIGNFEYGSKWLGAFNAGFRFFITGFTPNK